MRQIELYLLIFLGAAAAWTQTADKGSIAGKTVDPNMLFVPWPTVGILSSDKAFPGMNNEGDKTGAFHLTGMAAGDYIFAAKVLGFREIVRPIRVEAGKETNLGTVFLPAGSCDDPGAACTNPKNETGEVPVLTVCEALLKRDLYFSRQVILVGRLVEMRREMTLNANCPFGLATGSFAWPVSVALSDAAGARLPTLPTGFKWNEKALDKAKDALPLDAKPGNIAAIFGRFESPAGLVTLDCPHRVNCSLDMAMLPIPPALLIQDSARTQRALE